MSKKDTPKTDIESGENLALRSASKGEPALGARVLDLKDHVAALERLDLERWLGGVENRLAVVEGRLAAVEEPSRPISQPDGEADKQAEPPEGQSSGPPAGRDESEREAANVSGPVEAADSRAGEPEGLAAAVEEPGEAPGHAKESDSVEPREEAIPSADEGESADPLSEEALPEQWSTKELIEELWEEEVDQSNRDHRVYEKMLGEVRDWNERGEALSQGIEGAVECWKETLEKATRTIEKLPPALQDKLKGRRQGLELSAKMLTRLLDHRGRPESETVPDAELRENSEADLRDLILDQKDQDRASARDAAVKKLEPVRNARYQSIANVRALVQKLCKRFLGFTEKQLLPVIDGLDDGERASSSLMESLNKLKTEDPSQKDRLNSWFQTYDHLRKVLIELLEKSHVHRMNVELEVPIDFERHEPFDTEPDPNLNTEDIKEVSRNGYLYRLGAGSADAGGPGPDEESGFVVLRPALVIVVKN